MAAIWTDLFESLLAPPPELKLRWAGKGPGIDRDARVAYSSLLGRFVARAHLTTDLGVRVLVPLDVAKTALESVGYWIRTKQGDPGYRADWIGCDHSGLVIAEAKGNHSGGIAPQGVQPPSILRPAIRQVTRTEVWDSNEVPARRVAIASRWATQQKHRCDPELLVWDSAPSQTRQPDPALVAALLRVDGTQILRGMGYSASHHLESTANPELRSVVFQGHEFEPGHIAVADAKGLRPISDRSARCPPAPAYLVFSEAHRTAAKHGEPRHFEPRISDRWAQAGGLSVLWPRPEDEIRFLSPG